jgi:hypothetical protein
LFERNWIRIASQEPPCRPKAALPMRSNSDQNANGASNGTVRACQNPGVRTYDSFQFAAGHGASPGGGTLTLPLSGFGEGLRKDLVIDIQVYDGVESFVLRQCKVDSIAVASAGAKRYQLNILDRRWKWPFSTISASYNIRDENGEIKPFSKKGLPNLINEPLDCLEEPFPRTIDELPQVTDRVSIREIGKGADLPSGGTIERTPTLDFIESAPPVFQAGLTNIGVTVLLEPVGSEMDGTIRPLWELSYRPRLFGECAPVESPGYTLTKEEALNPWLALLKPPGLRAFRVDEVRRIPLESATL